MRGFFIAITAVMFMPHISQAHVSLHCPAGFLEVNSYGGSLTGGQGILLPRSSEPLTYLPEAPSGISMIQKQKRPKTQRSINEQNARESKWHSGDLLPRCQSTNTARHSE